MRDIERSRQNSFGRKIFEAEAAEYLSSHYAENTEVSKLKSFWNHAILN